MPDTIDPPEDEKLLGIRVIEDIDEPWVQYEGADFYSALVGDSMIGEDSRLTTASRKQLKPSSFADPENKAYPVHDASHARNALVRFIQFGRRKYQGAKRRSVAARILAACRRFGVKVSDAVRKRLLGDSEMDSELLSSIDSMSLRGLVISHRMWHQQYGYDAEDTDMEHDALILAIQRFREKK